MTPTRKSLWSFRPVQRRRLLFLARWKRKERENAKQIENDPHRNSDLVVCALRDNLLYQYFLRKSFVSSARGLIPYNCSHGTTGAEYSQLPLPFLQRYLYDDRKEQTHSLGFILWHMRTIVNLEVLFPLPLCGTTKEKTCGNSIGIAYSVRLIGVANALQDYLKSTAHFLGKNRGSFKGLQVIMSSAERNCGEAPCCSKLAHAAISLIFTEVPSFSVLALSRRLLIASSFSSFARQSPLWEALFATSCNLSRRNQVLEGFMQTTCFQITLGQSGLVLRPGNE